MKLNKYKIIIFYYTVAVILNRKLKLELLSFSAHKV